MLKLRSSGLSNTEPGHEKPQSRGSAELRPRPFDLILKNSIDEVFRYALGEGGAQALKYNLKLGEYWENPKEFHNRLVSVMKDGALVLEYLIVKDLFRELGAGYEVVRPIDFGKRIASARKFHEGIEGRGAATE